MPRTQEAIKKDDRFWAAVLPYVLHSVLKKIFSVTLEGPMGGGKNILSLTQDLESPDLHNALLGHSFIVRGWAIHHQCQKPCFWAYTMVTQVGSLMRFGEGCLNHILSGLQHPTFSYKDSLSPWDLELCFSPNRQLVVPHNNFVFFLTKPRGNCAQLSPYFCT